MSERGVDVPAELSEALGADVTARRAFEALPPSHQREYVEWIQEAKRDDTRRRRVQEAIRRIREGAGPAATEA